MKFENINEIILSLLLWITSNTDYGNISVNPKVQFLVQSELAELACNRPCEIIAYTPKDSKEKSIYPKILIQLKMYVIEVYYFMN